jgi:hypothetical protein
MEQMKRIFSLIITLALFACIAFASSWHGWSDTTARSVTGSSTQYAYLLGPGAAFSSTESSRQQTAPDKGYIQNLYITTISSQPGDGSLTCRVRVNASDSDGDGETLVVTIPVNSAAGTYSIVKSSLRIERGDKVDLKCVNAATTTSAAISEVRFALN